jgi:hypothetical protein
MVRAMVAQGFAAAGEGVLFSVATRPAEALDLAEAGPVVDRRFPSVER